MGPIQIHNIMAEIKRMSKILMLITSVRVEIQLNLFIEQFLKGNSMGPIKINNGGNQGHAQDSNACNFS